MKITKKNTFCVLMENHELCVCHVHTLQVVGRTERTVLCIAIELNIVYFRHIKLVQFTYIGPYSNLQMCTHAVGRNDRAISHSRVDVHICIIFCATTNCAALYILKLCYMVYFR